MPEFLRELLSSEGFMPHGHCYLWKPEIVWLHVISDALVAGSYTTIPFTLYYVARRRKDLPFNWMFMCFALFIVACGATHYMEIWTLWTPVYRLSGVIKAITALASVPTAILLVKLVPQALALPTADQLAKAHEDLRRAHEALESRVEERTAALTRKNAELSREILERERAEEALRRSEARFRRLDDAGIIGIILAEDSGSVIEANTAFLDMLGYTSEDVRSGSLRWTEMTPPAWKDLDQRAIAQLRSQGVASAFEKEYLRKDGSRVPVLVGAATLDEGQCIAFVLDLTDRRKAEASLRQSEARKTSVMDAALDAIVIMDHGGTITEFNQAAERTFGYSAAEAIGRPLADLLIPAALRQKHRTGLVGYLQTGEGAIIGKRVEVPALKKDGVEFPAEVAVVRIQSQDPPMFTGYIRDITDRRQAAEAAMLRRAKEASDEANAELEAFSYSVAHDLRAPLRAISGFSTTLVEDYGDKLGEEARASLARIVGGAHRMAEIIDALLGLARLTRAEPRREPVNLTHVARDVMADLRATEPSRAVDFVVEDDLVCEGDPQLLRALLENLLGNAWKFTGKRALARIEVGREPVGDTGTRAVYIRDNGVGFDMTHVGKLFAPFRRLHSGEDYEGTGIGLATVQRIVRRHGGRVWADSAENEGATFRFTLSDRDPSGSVSWPPTK